MTNSVCVYASSMDMGSFSVSAEDALVIKLMYACIIRFAAILFSREKPQAEADQMVPLRVSKENLSIKY